MIKIPTGSRVVSNRSTSTGAVETGATQLAVSGASSAMSFVQKWKEENDKTQLQEAINTATKKVNDWKNQNLKRTGKEAEGLTEEYLQFSKEIESELSGKLSNNGKKMFSQWAFQNTESDRMNLASYQHKQSLQVKHDAFNEGVTIAQETIRTDARQWGKAMEHLGNTLELGRQSGVIRDEDFESTKTEMINKMRTEIGKSYYTQDKHEFMKGIDQFGFGKPEIEAYKQKYQHDLAAEDREKKSLFAEEAKLLFAKRDDMKAQAIANEDTSHFFENADKLEKMGYSQWASELREEGNQYKSVIGFHAEHKNKPLKEVLQAAQSLKVGDELDGSSSELKGNLAIQKEVMQQAKVFNADPAEYVSKWAQGVTMEDIATSRLSLQQSQGIYPAKGFKVLTIEEKKLFNGEWEAGDMKQRTDLVYKTFKYGKHTSRALEEAGVNSSLVLAPLLGDEKDIELLVAGVSHKAELLDDATSADYKAAAKGSEFYNFLTKVQAKFPTNPDLPQKIADIEKAMTGIGARKVDPEAGAKFFDEKIRTLESSDKLVYFPNTVDEDEVEDMLDKKKEEYLTKFKTDDKQKGTLAKWAVRDAVWVNTSGGFALMDERSGTFLPGSEMNILEIDTLRKDLVKAKTKQANDLVTQTFMRR